MATGTHPFIGDMIMKFETFMLRALFVSCMAVCSLVMGAMLTATPSAVQLASSHSVSSILPAAPTACALPADGVVCPRLNG
jgi:hypothetical protein